MSVTRTATTRELASFLSGLRFEDLPDEVVERTKELFLDWAAPAHLAALRRARERRRVARCRAGRPPQRFCFPPGDRGLRCRPRCSPADRGLGTRPDLRLGSRLRDRGEGRKL